MNTTIQISEQMPNDLREVLIDTLEDWKRGTTWKTSMKPLEPEEKPRKLEDCEAFQALSPQDKEGVLYAIKMGTRYGAEYDFLPRPIEYYVGLAIDMGLIKEYPLVRSGLLSRLG